MRFHPSHYIRTSFRNTVAKCLSWKASVATRPNQDPRPTGRRMKWNACVETCESNRQRLFAFANLWHNKADAVSEMRLWAISHHTKPFFTVLSAFPNFNFAFFPRHLVDICLFACDAFFLHLRSNAICDYAALNYDENFTYPKEFASTRMSRQYH